jgi:hypothetical protein
MVEINELSPTTTKYNLRKEQTFEIFFKKILP